MSVRAKSVPGILLVLLVVSSLAGCFGKGGDKGGDVVNPTLVPTFNAETGAIQGLLVNDEGLPVATGQVGLQQDASLRTTTDAAGAFVFSDLAPGTYSLEAQAIGYDRRIQQVEVAPGAATEVEIRLVASALQGVSYSVTFGPIPGKFFCAFGAGNTQAEAGVAGPCKAASVGGPLQPAEDGYQGVAQGETNIFEYADAIAGNRTLESDVFRSLVVEVQWVPTSGAAGTLQAAVEKYQRDGRDPTADDFLTYASTVGGSPLLLALHAGETHASEGVEFPVDVEAFQLGVFPAFADTPQVFTEQRFDLWMTLFYNQPAPEAFTVLADA